MSPGVETVEAIWDRLSGTLTDEFPGGRPLPNECTTLLSQAILAYRAGANDAAVIVCRSAIEAAGWTYLFFRWTGHGWDGRAIPRRARGGKWEVAYTGLREIHRGLRREKALPRPLLAAFGRIKDDGDAVAHFSEGAIRREEAAIGEYHRRVVAGKRAELAPVKLWNTAKDAEARIRETADILLELSRASARRAALPAVAVTPKPG